MRLPLAADFSISVWPVNYGLPFVCADHSGRKNLREHVNDPNIIKVMPSDDVEALVGSIKKMISIVIIK